MKDYLDFFLLTGTTLFTMINPFGAMPMFLKFSKGSNFKEARKMAQTAALTSLCAMVFFSLTGQLIFNFFSVSLDALRVVGGILFFLSGYDMLQAKMPRTKTESDEPEYVSTDVAITPLGIPLLCGPGSITAVIILNQQAQTWAFKTTLYSAMILVIIAVFLILTASKRLIALLGESGTNVMFRLMGLIVMVIAVEFFFKGIRSLLHLDPSIVSQLDTIFGM